MISKKEISKLKLVPKNPLSLTCEKVTQTPRIFNTSQIKSAIENISFIDIEEKITPDILSASAEYILKDFFLYMHQTGLYNRQFKLWKTLGNITQCVFSRLQKGLLTKNDLSIYIIDFFIDPKTPCINAIVNEDTETSTELEFKACLSKNLEINNMDRLKGVFYFLNKVPDETFMSKLDQMINSLDPISKYESRLSDFKDIRLNIINYQKENEKYTFKHIYPELRSAKNEEMKIKG